MKRRDLLKSSALALAVEAPRAAPASDRLGVGVIGCGGMGSVDQQDFQRNRDVEIVAVCDVNQENAARARERSGGGARVYVDYRRLLEDRAVEAVIIATPDHWHAKIFVDACSAGKDIYLEKPIANSIREGRLMVDAARRANRIVQVGLQQRSGSHFQRAVKLIQDGQLGDIHFVECFYRSASRPFVWPQSSRPAGLDWDFWLGPAPESPYSLARHRNWRSFYDYGGGIMTDWGVHVIDIALWAMKAAAPLSVTSVGARYLAENRNDASGGDTADTQAVLYEFPGFLLQFSKLANNSFGPHGKLGSDKFGAYGTLFHGSLGTLFIDRAGYEVVPQWVGGPDPNAGPDARGEWGQSTSDRTDDGLAVSAVFASQRGAERGTRSFTHFPHVRNFLDSVKTRRKPAVDIEDGHRVTSTCHLANISLRTGQKLAWDAKAERITNWPGANDLLLRDYRAPWHLEGL